MAEDIRTDLSNSSGGLSSFSGSLGSSSGSSIGSGGGGRLGFDLLDGGSAISITFSRENLLLASFLIIIIGSIGNRPLRSVFDLIVNFVDLEELSTLGLDGNQTGLFPLNTIVGLSSELTIVELDEVETLVFVGNFRPTSVEDTGVGVAVIDGEEILTRVPLTVLHEDFATEIGDVIFLDDGEIVTETVPQLQVIEREQSIEVDFLLPQESREGKLVVESAIFGEESLE